MDNVPSEGLSTNTSCINLDEIDICNSDSDDSDLIEWLRVPIQPDIEEFVQASLPKDIHVSPIPCVKEMEQPFDKALNQPDCLQQISSPMKTSDSNASGEGRTSYINLDVVDMWNSDSWLHLPILQETEKFVQASVPKDIHVSPIPCVQEMEGPVDKALNQPDSLQQISSPLNTPDTKRAFHSCSESPIEIRHVAASTPFRGQILSSSSSQPSNHLKDVVKIGKGNNSTFIAGGNDTFPLPTKPMTEDVSEVMDCTWSTGDKNDTYTKKQNDSVSSKRLTFCKPANTTFDVEITKNDGDQNMVANSTFDIGDAHDELNKKSMVPDQPTEENQNSSTSQNLSIKTNESISNTTRDSGSDMESCVLLESIAESSKGNLHRKPLASLPQPTNSRLKPTMKRPSRLAAPRMNTAALSRIQARSPTKNSDVSGSKAANSGGKFSGNCHKPIISRSPPSSASNTLRQRPNNARKSFLPPPCSTKSKKSSVPVADIENSTDAANTQPPIDRSNTKTKSPELTPTKRKAQESPKRIGRSAKFSGNRAESSVPSRLSLAPSRSTSAPTSRVASIASRTSRLQRSTGLKAPSTSSRFSTLPSSSVRLTNGVGRACSASTTKISTGSKSKDHASCSPTKTLQKNATPSLTIAGNIRNEKAHMSAEKAKSGKCTTSLAILLDYVVNKLDGLSAPRLQGEKQQLERLLQDKKELSDSLTVKLDDLKQSLQASKEAHQYDVRELTEVHERTVEKINKEHENVVNQLSSELEKEREEYREQKVQFQLQQDAMRSTHEETVARLRSEWEIEQEKLLAEIKEISDNIESRIQEEVEEKIQPYINAKAEVESLTVVLEMRNDEIHKLHNQTSQQTMQREQIRNLQSKVEQLTQKNEDLSMQLQEKVDENRNTAVACNKLRHSVEEEQNRSIKLRQQNEELVYQLNSASPSPSSSFNPVFTPSPTVSNSPQMFSASLGSTPINAMMRRSTYSKSTSKTESTSSAIVFPRLLSYANDNNGN